MKQFDGVQVIKALSNGGLLFDGSGFSKWYKVYYPETGVLSELSKFNANCRMLDMEMYVESLELLDKGGKTMSWEKKRRKGKVESPELLIAHLLDAEPLHARRNLHICTVRTNAASSGNEINSFRIDKGQI
ncbi:hypothetical protein Tco_1239073 [Tanacetum coccineum]